ncbi:hypothetical protein JX265_006629 [Neoarthrinium moseri]|uniref:Uncharacterized protein n=1 Tax=Neoarthrinium moseri TaxID=1658444 RepID=A0A9Q0AQP7_9PEZI|nr:hypothetical protein JX265_006629 [Neoarthrinium moseri]
MHIMQAIRGPRTAEQDDDLEYDAKGVNMMIAGDHLSSRRTIPKSAQPTEYQGGLTGLAATAGMPAAKPLPDLPATPEP